MARTLATLITMVLLIAGTTNYADAKSASGAAAGALGKAAAKQVGKGATKGAIMCTQTYVIKNGKREEDMDCIRY
jgi:hypothetical protein